MHSKPFLIFRFAHPRRVLRENAAVHTWSALRDFFFFVKNQLSIFGKHFALFAGSMLVLEGGHGRISKTVHHTAHNAAFDVRALCRELRIHAQRGPPSIFRRVDTRSIISQYHKGWGHKKLGGKQSVLSALFPYDRLKSSRSGLAAV